MGHDYQGLTPCWDFRSTAIELGMRRNCPKATVPRPMGFIHRRDFALRLRCPVVKVTLSGLSWGAEEQMGGGGCPGLSFTAPLIPGWFFLADLYLSVICLHLCADVTVFFSSLKQTNGYDGEVYGSQPLSRRSGRVSTGHLHGTEFKQVAAKLLKNIAQSRCFCFCVTLVPSPTHPQHMTE